MPKVSIIINCLNGERYLKDCIDSVVAQTYEDWEIIFWDNGSTDGTSEIAQSYGTKIKYFRSEYTTDLGMARHRAYQRTQGDYIAILDSDDIWLPDKLARQVELVSSNEELGLVYCDSIMFDDGGDRFRQFSTCTPKRGYVLGDLLAANFIFSSTMMFSRAALNQLQYVFDKSLSRAQDYDLTLRLARVFPVDYIDEPLNKWRMYQNNSAWLDWKSSLVPRVVEVKIVVEQLLKNYPEIKISHYADVRLCYKEIDYNLGIVEWQNGNRIEARRYFGKHFKDMKSTVVYFSTFLFSYRVFERMKNKYKNVVVSGIRSLTS